ncbi:MAG: hypothetical protein IKJ82_08080 [Oscillospiraceae bacterium]|nr:hypothetical protein [Oscillospiraceae bacterium]
MKKIISFALLFLIILSSAVMAFAGEKNGRISVYASEEEVPSVLGSIKETKLNVSLNEHGITIDTETVMPIYYASIYDYAKSGEFSFVPHTLEEKQLYAADVISEDGEFAGVIMFTKDIMLMYMPSDSEADSVDFAGANSKRIESLTGEKTDSLIDKSLFAFVEGMGFVYYIDSGETKSFVSSNFNGSNGDIFTAENRGIIKIDDKLKVVAKKMADERDAEREYLSALESGENPPTGAAVPAFLLDGDENSFSAMNISAVFLAAAVFFFIGYLFIPKKHKNK